MLCKYESCRDAGAGNDDMCQHVTRDRADDMQARWPTGVLDGLDAVNDAGEEAEERLGLPGN